jgi:hypothetical protein
MDRERAIGHPKKYNISELDVTSALRGKRGKDL